tara:strand:+ start:3577 stop:4692 length:1116 start_codon:yes stop_codon:yes gene_type:complete
MSQALQSLNNILKYRQERESQKINESLSMMEVGTRLQQQKYDREFQIQTIKLRNAREKRDVSKSDKDNRALDLQIQSFEAELAKKRREESPTNIVYKEEMKALAKAGAEQQLSGIKKKAEITDYEIDEIKKARVVEKKEKLDAALGGMQYKQNTAIISAIQKTGVIPSYVFSIAEDLVRDGEYSAQDMNSIVGLINDKARKIESDKSGFLGKKDRTKSKYIKKLINNPDYGNKIIGGIISYERSKKIGEADGSDLLESLDSFYNSIVTNQNVDFQKTASDAGLSDSFNKVLYANQISQKSKKSIENAKISGEFQISLDKMAKVEVEKEMEELVGMIAKEYGGSYTAPATDEEIDTLLEINPHLSRSDFKND